LELTFHTAELREICEKRSVAAAEFGYAAARELAERLADIEALDTVAELSLLRPEAICDTDWKTTSRMKITSIEPING
jgi:hypothetical protein